MDLRQPQRLNSEPYSLNALRPGKIIIDVEMNGIPTVAMIDSGAARDYLSASYAAD